MNKSYLKLSSLIQEYKKNIVDIKPIGNVAISTISKIKAWSNTKREQSAGSELYAKMSRKDPLIADLNKLKNLKIPKKDQEFTLWETDAKKALEYPGSIYTSTNLADYWCFTQPPMKREMFEAVLFSQLEAADKYNRSTITYRSIYTLPRFTKTSVLAEYEMVETSSKELAGNILYPTWITPRLSDHDAEIKKEILKRVAKGKPILNDDEFVQLIQTLTNKKKRDIVTSFGFDETTIWAFDLYSSRFYEPFIVTPFSVETSPNSIVLEDVCKYLIYHAFNVKSSTQRSDILHALETTTFHGKKIGCYNLSMYSGYQNMCRLILGQSGTSIMPCNGLICSREASGQRQTIIHKGRMLTVFSGESTLRGEYRQHFTYHCKRRGKGTLDTQEILMISYDRRMNKTPSIVIKDFFFDLLFECRIMAFFDIFKGINYPRDKNLKSFLKNRWISMTDQEISTLMSLVLSGSSLSYGLTSELKFGSPSLLKVIEIETTISPQTENVEIDDGLALWQRNVDTGSSLLWDVTDMELLNILPKKPIGLITEISQEHSIDHILKEAIQLSKDYHPEVLKLALLNDDLYEVFGKDGKLSIKIAKLETYNIKCGVALKSNWMKKQHAEIFKSSVMPYTLLVRIALPHLHQVLTINNKTINWGSNNFRHLEGNTFFIMGNLYDSKTNTSFRIRFELATPKDMIDIMVGKEVDVLTTGIPRIIYKENIPFVATRTNEVHDMNKILWSLNKETQLLLKRKQTPDSEDSDEEQEPKRICLSSNSSTVGEYPVSSCGYGTPASPEMSTCSNNYDD